MKLVNQLDSVWLSNLARELLDIGRSVQNRLQAIVEGSQPFDAVLLSLLLIWIGRRVSRERAYLQRLGSTIALAVFIVYGSTHTALTPVPIASELLGILFRSILSAGLTLGIAWILLPPISVIFDVVLISCVRFPLKGLRFLQESARAFRRIWKKRSDLLRTAAAEVQSRPERERQQLQKAERDSREARQQQELRQQREKLRFDIQLIYDRHRAELADALPPERFEVYFDRYLTDQIDPSAYSQRAEELREMIRELAGMKSENRLPEFEGIEQVIEYFRAKKQRLQLLDLDEDTLETLEVTLEEIQDREIRRLLG